MIKPKVILEPDFHRDVNVLKILFKKNDDLLSRLKRFPKLRWSQTHKSWYLPYNQNLVNELFLLLNGIAYLDDSALIKANLEDLKPWHTEQRQMNSAGHLNRPGDLKSEQALKLNAFSDWMRSRRYSESTIGTYTEALKIFLNYFHDRCLEDISNDDVINFNTRYLLANNRSASYQNQVVNALKLFFRTQHHRSLDVSLVHRPKRAKVLPNVLSKDEVKRLLSVPANIKHRAMLSLIYSCGLRCGELLRLKFEHIDAKRNLLLIKHSKGKKDRIVPLSKKTIELLRDYYKTFSPKVFLFEGQKEGCMYDERSLQQVLKQNLIKAGIKKPVTLHWLRHSYATHLLEAGTDLRYIQEILGHSRSTTTEIYTHVSTRSIQNIVSPYDDLV